MDGWETDIGIEGNLLEIGILFVVVSGEEAFPVYTFHLYSFSCQVGSGNCSECDRIGVQTTITASKRIQVLRSVQRNKSRTNSHGVSMLWFRWSAHDMLTGPLLRLPSYRCCINMHCCVAELPSGLTTQRLPLPENISDKRLPLTSTRPRVARSVPAGEKLCR